MNKKNKNKYYLINDIKKIVNKKYTDLREIQKIKDMRYNRQQNIQTKKEIKIIKRRNKLIRELQRNKLEFRYSGDHYSYINYGTPNINTIIKHESQKQNTKNIRRMRLLQKLQTKNIELDESLDSCYNYINNLGCDEIDEVVRLVEIEYFLKYKTDYIKLRKKYDEAKAKEIAIHRFFYGSDKKSKIILEFD